MEQYLNKNNRQTMSASSGDSHDLESPGKLEASCSKFPTIVRSRQDYDVKYSKLKPTFVGHLSRDHSSYVHQEAYQKDFHSLRKIEQGSLEL